MAFICEHLIGNIQFLHNRIIPCGSVNLSDFDIAKEHFIGIDDEKFGIDVDFEEYLSKTGKYIDMYRNGEMPLFCKNCSLYSPIIYNPMKNRRAFNNVYISHETKCSCKCVYCCLANEGKEKFFEEMNEREVYDIKPILQKMAQMNLIDSDTKICIFGGECSEYPDLLEYIADWGISKNCRFLILSNAIIYNEIIEKLLKYHKTELRVSLDSGTKETFEKIKRVKAFDRVKQNIKKYSEAARNNQNSLIELKYILCPNLNDKKSELKNFLNLASEVEANQVILSINRFWLNANKDKEIPFQIKDFINFYLRRKDYKGVKRTIDYGELWKWYVDKALDFGAFAKIKSLIYNNFNWK